jgi:hypothetical protein
VRKGRRAAGMGCLYADERAMMGNSTEVEI